MAADLYDDLVAELPHLRGFARVLTGDPQQADDLLQDCVLRVLAAGEERPERPGLRVWLFVILRNRYIDLCRRQARRPDDTPLDDKEHELSSADLHGTSGFLHDLRRALAQLPEDLREITWLVCVEELTYAETAEVVGIPIGTVRSRVFRARELLRTKLQEYWTPHQAR